MKRYDPRTIEPKWQKIWAKTSINEADDKSSKPKYYALSFFPYPSGVGLHIGHTRNFTITDVAARAKRMQGYSVLQPMGWDSFGLPGENYAIKTGISPQMTTKQNTDNFRAQCKKLGLSIDWSREFSSTDPSYYKWTQWFFLLLLERGLAYRQESSQWWCNECKTVLANEQVVNGCCWRHEDKPVTKKLLNQWFFKITDYADRLAEDLEGLDWPEGIKLMQRNWIGKSKGALVNFKIEGSSDSLSVFTTRPDTLFGASFMVIAPEHPLVNELTTKSQEKEVTKYLDVVGRKTDIERQEDSAKEKTGVFSGSYAINPVNNQKIPIWIADYVLMGYGTGAIMAVPAHDERDYQFATKFNLPIIEVVKPKKPTEECFSGEGTMVNSAQYDGLPSSQAREKIVADLVKNGAGEEKTNYKIRDWLISRQRYWGAPIPIVHCQKDGIVPLPKSQLPLELPALEKFQPSGDGRSPLANATNWVNTTCPKCGGPATRETDTMDGFACSSWYFLRFADPKNNEEPFSKEKADHWLPVDLYVGGAEHAVMHLLYARMWTKVMEDAGLINFGEPFKALRNQGMLLAADGQKISKSKGNDIKPDEIIDQGYGADSLRMIVLFLAPFDMSTPWSNEGLAGVFRFLQRVWTITQKFIDYKDQPNQPINSEAEGELLSSTHTAIKKVSQDIESMGYNTAIAALMKFTNELYVIEKKYGFCDISNWQFALDSLTQLLAPFAPHITEELWQDLGNEGSVHASSWPVHDEGYLVKHVMHIAIQVNGKLRGEIEVSHDASQELIEAEAKVHPNVASYLKSDIKKVIYVPSKIINFVV
ncbi:leucine--tRNA ligase [Candidatus Saccharibacteria bacterium]|nr:leucine--tRNA ligase [Candidatus Saccharibacteria bacterium]